MLTSPPVNLLFSILETWLLGLKSSRVVFEQEHDILYRNSLKQPQGRPVALKSNASNI